MNNVPFGIRLRLRRVTQADLAKAIGSSRAHVCQVLNGVPGRGGKTRKKLAPLLTEAECNLLGWDSKGNLLEKARVGGWSGIRMTNGHWSLLFHAEQNVPIGSTPSLP